MTDKYILDGKTPVPCDDLMKWAKHFEDRNRRISWTDVGGAWISTVFLGLDHSFDPDGPPLLFETVVFGGTRDGEMRRYATYEEAEVGHPQTVQAVLEESG